jgi:diguanylate cyclase (GGDEF)-like protein/PAS domain S-box-containing protein
VEGILGSSLFDYVDAADRDAVRERVAWVLSTGESLTGENRMAVDGGDERWFAWTNTLQRTADGSPLLHSVGRDISARKRAERALRASRAFLERTGRAAGVGGWELDLASGALLWSDQTRRLHEVGPDFQPTLENAIAFYAPQVRPRIEQAVQAGMADGTPWDLELPFVTARGRALWVRAVGEVEFEGGRPVRLVGAVQDITERVHAAQELQRQSAILRSVTEATPAVVSVVDRALRYRFVNGAFERWYGIGRDQVLGRTALEIMPGADVERSMAWAQRALAGETVHFERDHPERPGAPHLAVDYIPLRLDDGSIDGFVGIAQDVTRQRHEAQRLRLLSQTDPLTGLLNRAGFEQQLANLLDEHVGEPLALLYVDLDRFKPVNDSHGHAVGDTLLRAFSKRLVRLVRPSDAVARLGGDEFAVLLPGMHDVAQAERVARKVVEAAQQPFELPEHPGLLPLQVGASVGGAVGVAVRSDWPALLARADRMLYRAKAEGRGRYAVDVGDQLGA